MNINDLPEEILVRILSFLPPSDRLESALTCRLWAQTVARTPQLLRDVQLEITESRMEEAEIVFAHSHRQYENLWLPNVSSLNFNAAFWTNVGPTLRNLNISEYCLPEVLYSILKACSNLESLRVGVSHSNGRKFKFSELPPSEELDKIQKSMRNLRHLDLHCRVDADTLEHCFILMPNVSSVSLHGFDTESDILSRLPEILGTSRRITRLSLDWKYGSAKCEQLLRISSASLTDLSYYGRIPAPTALDALRNCSLLRKLSFCLGSDCYSSILRNFPELESLLIVNDVPFRQEDVMAICDLRKLRKLYLYFRPETGSNTYVPDEIVCGLSRMITLETLRLGSAFGISDSTRFRSFAGMPNLRELELHNVEWDAEFLRIVLFDSKNLRKLDIRGHPSRDGMRARHSELEGNTLTSQGSSRSDPQEEPKFSSLAVLRMYNIPLTDACLGLIAAHHSRLKTVSFSRCNGITDAGLVTLFQREPLLKELEIHSAGNLDGTFLGSLGELCPRLRLFEVHDCNKINNRALEEFRSRWPGIQCSYFGMMSRLQLESESNPE